MTDTWCVVRQIDGEDSWMTAVEFMQSKEEAIKLAEKFNSLPGDDVQYVIMTSDEFYVEWERRNPL